MKDNITTISDSLKAGEYRSNPHGCAEAKARLAGEYSFFSEQLEEVLARKPAVWNLKRNDFKSDQACERWWQATPEGIDETGLRLKLKRIEKLISALNSLIRVAEGEARNQY